MRISPVVALAVLVVAAGQAGAQARADSASADSARRITPVRVTVTRASDDALRLPWSVSVQNAADIRLGQPTLGADEALNNVPGVLASNRHIYALDQLRLSVRGAGARANFGARGVKILLDGVPQTLPDGQSQMTNIELGNVGRIEVLRGAASSLYGNGSGGVISFETDMRAPYPLQQDIRAISGSFGLSKWQFRTVGRTARTLSALSVSQTKIEGFRQHSGAEVRQVNGAMNYALGASTTLELRANFGRTPRSLNPGALTEAEWTENPDSAVATNVLRGASKEVTQQQASVGIRRDAGGPTSWRAVVFYSMRTVDNPLAAQPPAPRRPENGTRVQLDRDAVGARFDVVRAFGDSDRPPRLTAGLDVQRFSDERRNQRTTFGIITALNDTILVDQAESVLGGGPFAQLTWSPLPLATMSLGGRYDYHTFKAEDRHLKDGFDDSGERTMSAPSGHLGLSIYASPMFVPFANVATAFETPTTTEMQVQASGLGGLNTDLDPQTSRTVEFGVRGANPRVAYEVIGFRGVTEDALIQYAAENDRTYFRNAGSLTSLGAEVGLRVFPSPWFEARLAYTFARYEFEEYRIPTDDGETVLDGKRLAGVPEHFVRAGTRATLGTMTFDADWTWSGEVWGDDLNTTRIDGWGAGRLDLRLTWTATSLGQRFTPFVGVNNVLDEAYVGSVTLNGFGGRYRESAPRRNWFAGLELGWSVVQ